MTRLRALVAVAVLHTVLHAQIPGDAKVACEAAIQRADFNAAAEQAHALLRLEPRSADAWVLLAQAEMGRNRANTALKALQQALTFQPRHLDALYYLSKLAGIRSQQELGDVMQTAPDSARAHQIMGEIYQNEQQLDKAEHELRLALERNPGATAIFVALGDVQRENHRCEPAIEIYAKALQKDSSNYDALYGTGACHLLLKNSQQAEKWFRRALQVDANSTAARVALGEILLTLGKPLDALPMLEAAAKIDPNIRRLQFLLAKAYHATGDESSSKQAFARVRELAKAEQESDVDDLEQAQP